MIEIFSFLTHSKYRMSVLYWFPCRVMTGSQYVSYLVGNQFPHGHVLLGVCQRHHHHSCSITETGRKLEQRENVNPAIFTYRLQAQSTQAIPDEEE